MKKIDKICADVLHKMVATEAETWPPTCIGLLYQPERPAYDVETPTEDKNS